jgi:hypothetical protein
MVSRPWAPPCASPERGAAGELECLHPFSDDPLDISPEDGGILGEWEHSLTNVDQYLNPIPQCQQGSPDLDEWLSRSSHIDYGLHI